MTSYSLIRAGAHRVMPWKNGGGTTAEIAISPPGASVATGFADSQFEWRLSIATIGSDGPFSAFPQHDRVIMLLAGNGMTLDFADGERVVLDRKHRPLPFAGDRGADCRLIDGPCQDLNLMVARDALAATVAVGRDAAWTADGPRDATRVLFVLEGGGECRGPVGRALPLRSRDTLIVAPGEAPPTIVPAQDFIGFTATIRRR